MARFGFVLGVLSTAGPLAIDMYLPALPSIARDLHATQGQVEASMMAFFIGLTVSQPLYGPISDRIGRRPPIIFGLLLYVAASLACSFASNVHLLIAGRVLQGLGAGASIAISSAIIRDRYTGMQAASLLALRMLVLGLSPILAPMMGATLISVEPWRSVFWFAACHGLLCAGVMFLIPETRHAEARAGSRLQDAFKVYGRLSLDRSFMGAVLTLACMQFGFVAYIAGSAFVLMTMNNLSPWFYSVIFSSNAVGFIGCAQLAPRLMRRFKPEQLILFAAMVQTLASLFLLGAALSHHLTVPVLIGPLFVFLACFGLVGGPSVVLALRDHAAVAGTASALLSFLQFGSAALGSGLVAALANGTALPMTGMMAVGACGGLLCARRAFRPRAVPAPV